MGGIPKTLLIYLRAATTSDGCTSCPVLLLQLFLVYVTTAARSVSDSCFQGGIAPLAAPLSTMCSCLALSASVTTGEPASALMAGGAPVPSGLWHTAQLAV